MAKALQIAGAICAACLMIAALSFYFAAPDLSIQQRSAQKTGAALAPAGPMNLSVLFPDLNPASITAVSLRTPERSFEFRRDEHNAVTVNGQRADSEIYQTLLTQIAELPVSTLDALPSGTGQLLTLVVTTGGQRRTAHFYDDGGAGTEAFILCGTQEAPQYRQTDGWRVGTLMMTCEGTRIEDASGNPASAY